MFDSLYNPVVDRWIQDDESDISLLNKICEYAGMKLKVTGEYIVIFRAEEFDKHLPNVTLDINSDAVMGYSFSSNSSDVYSACEIKYFDSVENDFKSYLFYPRDELGNPTGLSGTREKTKKETPRQATSTQTLGHSTDWIITTTQNFQPEPETEDDVQITDPAVGQILKVNARVKSLAEAENLAQSLLRNANQMQFTGSIQSIGRLDLCSGMNIKITGAGNFDDITWHIFQVTHTYSASGLNTDLAIRGVVGF